MSQSVVFQTPGLIDIRSFTTFGLNAKPNTANPIGFFGTGLKYATAVLCRLGAQPRVFIGRDEYQFYVRQQDFRGKDFGSIRMRRKRWSLLRPTHHELSYTTELGKTWEPWQAFRELESNTRDEQGQTYLLDNEPEGQEGQTMIVVDNDKFTEAYRDRDKTFLPGGLSVREGDSSMQVLDRPSKFVYYRGLRVKELEKPALYTYNVLSACSLTEDRTLKYDFEARMALARHVVTSSDAKLIEAVLTADDQHWEYHLDMDYVRSETPSDAFREVADRRRAALHPSARRYYTSWAGGGSSRARPIEVFDVHPRPWRVDGGAYILDGEGEQVLCRGLGISQVIGEKVLQTVVDTINASSEDE